MGFTRVTGLVGFLSRGTLSYTVPSGLVTRVRMKGRASSVGTASLFRVGSRRNSAVPSSRMVWL